MPNTIQIKRSSTASATPTAGQLSAGELAINTADSRLFAKNSAGTVVNLPVTSISGQTITPSKVTATSGAGLGTSADPATFSANARLVVYGDTFLGSAAAGAHVGVVAANTWDNAVDSAYIEALNCPPTAYTPLILTAGYFPQLALDTGGNIGVNTANPQATFQVITRDYYWDSANSVYTPTTSTLLGAGQTEILQVIAGGATYDAENDVYVPSEYVNLARFHVNDPTARGSFSLSNSGTGAWENNVLQFFVHGSTYSHGYYGSNTSDAGCAMIVTQGADISKLQIGNYNSAPIEFFTNNTRRMHIASAGNVGIGTASPAYKLDVNGNVNITGNLTVTGTMPSSGVLTDAQKAAINIFLYQNFR